MQAEQAKTLVDLMTGYWRDPVLDESDTAVWLSTMARCADARLAAQVLQEVSDTGVSFRPKPGVFHAAYVEAAKRKAAREHAPELESGERVASPEFASKFLAELSGGFLKRVADEIEGQAHATTVRQYISPERKKILAAVNEINEEGWVAP